MTWFYRNCIRPALFAQDSEAIHDFTLNALSQVSRSPVLCEAVESLFGAPELPVELFGLRFPNPVGLAAGMDKRAAAVPIWQSLGFGFSELGGITRYRQSGNPWPRMFRAETEGALVNRMGFRSMAKASGGNQSGKIENHSFGKGGRGLRLLVSIIAKSGGLFRRECQFSEYAESSPTSG